MAAPHATGTAALLLAINPALGASELASVLEDTGVPIVDTRNGLTFPRIDALAAMNSVLRMTSPLLGGGSGRTDCLVEWSFTPPTVTTLRPAVGAVCSDNDAACDGDQHSGGEQREDASGPERHRRHLHEVNTSRPPLGVMPAV